MAEKESALLQYLEVLKTTQNIPYSPVIASFLIFRVLFCILLFGCIPSLSGDSSGDPRQLGLDTWLTLQRKD